MRAEHPEIERAAAGIFLAAGADLEKSSDRSLLDEFGDHGEDGVIAVAMGDREFGPAFFAGGDDGIGLDEVAAKGFLDVEPFRPCLDRGEDHVVVLVDVARTDRNEFGLHRREHFAVAGVGGVRAELEPLDRFGSSLFRRIGNADDVSLGQAQPDRVEPVTILSLVRIADDANGPDFAFGSPGKGRKGGGKSGGESALEETAAGQVHGWAGWVVGRNPSRVRKAAVLARVSS